MGLILYLVGIVATVYAILDVFKKNISTACKLGVTIILLLTSWIGLLVYLFYAKDKIEQWCNNN